MALTAAEQAELAQLEKEIGSGLSQSEAQELAQLEAELGQPQEKVVNEMHPDISFKTRAVYKNFGADPEASFNYLQKSNPNLQWKKDKSGEVLAKKPNETEWRRLDPKGFDLQDITDIGYDIPAAIAQGAATAASGIAGAPLGGVGAIPAAMAGSAASGAALEGVRQGLGSYFMDDANNMSAADIGIAGGAGAVSPLLFGTGASAAQVLKAAGKEGAKQTSKEILKTQSGLLGRAYDKAAGYIGPKIGALVSGENAQVIKKAAENISDVMAADKNPEVRSLPLKEVAQNVPKKIKEVTTQAGQRLEELRNMIDNQPGLILTGEGASIKGTGTIPANEFMQPFVDLGEKLSKGGVRTDAQIKDIEALKKIIESEFKGLPENLTAAQVDVLRKRFKERAQQYGLNYGKTGQAVGGMEGVSAIDAQIAAAFDESRRKMNDSIITRLEKMAPEYAEEYAQLNDQYSYLKNVAKENNNKFKTSKSVSDFLARSTKDDLEAQNLLDIQKITGINLEDLATRDQALRTFSKPSTDIRSLGGTTSTSRSIPLAVAGGTAGYYLGQQSGGEYSPFLAAVLGGGLGSKMASPAALRNYMRLNQAVRSAPSEMPGYKFLPYLMMNPIKNDQGEK